jgi:two-component system sensor histidine kinase YesM
MILMNPLMIKKIQAWLRKLMLRDKPLMTKLMVYSGILVVLPMLLVGIISYRESSQMLEREAREYSWQIIEQVQHYVEDYFRNYEIDTLKIINHPDTAEYLRTAARGEINNEDMIGNVREVLMNSAYSRSDVENITLILEQGQVISSSDEGEIATVQDLKDEYWYESIPPSGVPRVFGRIIPWKDRQEPVISIVKRIVSPRTLKPFGMLIIDVNYKRLQDVARKVQLGESGKGYLFIVDEQGRYVYHPSHTVIGTAVNPDIVKVLQNTDSGSLITHEKQRNLLTFSTSESLDWQIVTSISYQELMKSTEYIGRTLFMTTAIFMVLAYILSIGFAASLVRPIKRLHQYMKRVEIGDLRGNMTVDSKDEIGVLSHGFNKMVERLSELLDEIYFSKLKETEMHLRQKDTELQMLQSQINPHFLYNSLETIRGMALEHDMDEISMMSASLARLLRYNVKGSSLSVSVKQEIEIAEIYLKIQKFRFEDRLDYVFDLPPWVMEEQMAKFTLQPLIENSIVHGLEHQLGTLQVKLTAERMNDHCFVIYITDTGPGIAPEKLYTLIQELESKESQNAQLGRIGLMNVHRRVRHIFGEQYGITIASEMGNGTRIGVVLPGLDQHRRKEGDVHEPNTDRRG